MSKVKPDIQENSVFESVRAGFKTVAGLATHVKIREDLIEDYAAGLEKLPDEDVLDEQSHYQGAPEDVAAYLLTLDALNFGSGYKPFMVKEGLALIRGSIYFTVSTRLKEYFEAHGPLSAQALRDIHEAQICDILGLNRQGPYSREFVGLCTRSLSALGAQVQEKGKGSFLAYIEKAVPSADAMVRQLAEMEGFNDVHDYKGRRIPFYKRAQHNVTTLNLQFNRHFQADAQALYEDADEVTMFADNAVPHVLRVDGILEYSRELADKIGRGEVIPSGSEEEIEIRACAGHATELIAAAKGMKAADIDFILWHRSVEDARYRATPTHRTFSWFY